MKNKFHLRFYLLFSLFIISCIYISCKKEPSNIGLNLIKDKLQTSYYSESNLSAINTYKSLDTVFNIKTALLGGFSETTDSAFGFSKAEFITTFSLNGNIDFENLKGPDSISLTLKYHNIYGDTNTVLNIKIYELQESLLYSSDGYDKDDIANYLNTSNELANITIPLIKPDTALLIDTLTIPLDFSLAEKLFNLGEDVYKDDSLFLENFHGLYITSETDGLVGSFDLLSEHSKLSLYYRDSIVDNIDTIITSESTTYDTIFKDVPATYDFFIRGSNARINIFDHNDYSSSSFTLDDSNDSLIYIQAMNGVESNITIPLEMWKDSSIAINKAELVLNISTVGKKDALPPSNRLFLTGIDENEESVLLIDYLTDPDLFNGYCKGDTLYRFVISRHIEDAILNKKDSVTLKLRVADIKESASRVILNEQTQSKGIRLNIVYTKL